MKLYAPKYYKHFTCIADKCTHSCCIGWEIDIDKDTLERYSKLSDGYGNNVKKSISREGTPHFRLAEHDRCPHLDSNGLCKIILNLGEDFLCDICRLHPRFFNDTLYGREVGLGMACEEACRLILTSSDYSEIEPVGEVNGQGAEGCFDGVDERNKLFGIISRSGMEYTEKLETVYKEYNISPDVNSDSDWQSILDSLEYLYEDSKDMFSCYSSDIATPAYAEKYLENALAYFIYRHVTGSVDESDFSSALGFCLFMERLAASIIKKYNAVCLEDIVTLMRTLSEELEYSEDNTETVKLEFLFG